MPDRPQDRKSTLISEEAADWLVILKEGNARFGERRRYVRWLKQSPAHIAEILRLSTLDGLLRRTDLEGLFVGPEDVDLRTESNVVDLVRRQPAAKAAPEIAQRSAISRHWKLAASVAALAISLLLGTIAKLAWFDNIIETEPGEWRHFALADGSIARVGPRSRLRVQFEDDRRLVYLSIGEAVFQVAKDSDRPFLVHAQSAIVRAVGTEFGVAYQNNAVVVTVAEGKVAVSHGGGRPLAEDVARDRSDAGAGADRTTRRSGICVTDAIE